MSSSVIAEVVAAFVDERDGGNLAGVVLDRSDLSETQMQSIAAQLGYSETAFISELHDGFRFDVFTPKVRVPDCGHATVAAFGLLAQRGRFSNSTIKHTIAGPRVIRFEGDGRVFMQQLPARYAPGPDPRTIAASLGLSEATAFVSSPTIARHDTAFLLVPLPHTGMLAAVVPNMRAIEAISQTADVAGYYVFAPADDPTFDATIRMFAPRVGIPEESATGMAAGLLAAFLHDCAGRTTDRFTFDQGTFMHPPSPSRLSAILGLENNAIADVWVGGHARMRSTRTLEV
ncbi:MAG: PhzF family phenazine biosynthesis protein [Candidatus Velthaea sp.]|jgi:PhzF family phenazine biosynthesis protein